MVHPCRQGRLEMSAVEVDPASFSSAGELKRVLSRLNRRITDLEDELGAEREQRLKLEG